MVLLASACDLAAMAWASILSVLWLGERRDLRPALANLDSEGKWGGSAADSASASVAAAAAAASASLFSRASLLRDAIISMCFSARGLENLLRGVLELE